MEDRSSRRMRTLVTHMGAPIEALSVNENACALISMMARSKSSNQRPDTLTQDRLPPDRRKPLATRFDKHSSLTDLTSRRQRERLDPA